MPPIAELAPPQTGQEYTHEQFRRNFEPNHIEHVLMNPLNTVESLTTLLLEHVPPAERDFVKKIASFGAKAHEKQKRKYDNPPVPYFHHPLGVALRIAHLEIADPRLKTRLIAAALLHDAKEDYVKNVYDEIKGVDDPETYKNVQSKKRKKDLRSLAHLKFKTDFEGTFKKEPQRDQLQEDIQLLNKYQEDGTEKAKEDYYDGIKELWVVKCFDRVDNLFADANRRASNIISREQLTKQINKTQEIHKYVHEFAPQVEGYLSASLAYSLAA
ncbi:MAG: hypothetical protein AAB553_04565 [Patescibacteria group bacterium]